MVSGESIIIRFFFKIFKSKKKFNFLFERITLVCYCFCYDERLRNFIDASSDTKEEDKQILITSLHQAPLHTAAQLQKSKPQNLLAQNLQVASQAKRSPWHKKRNFFQDSEGIFSKILCPQNV